jgi:integrase
MKKLHFDCECSEVWASPKNWKTITGKKALTENWYVQCVFFDPVFKEKYPKGFPFRKKLNKLKTLEERKAAIQLYIEEIPKLFFDKGYNPITKTFMIEPVQEVKMHLTELCPETPFNISLDLSVAMIKKASSTMEDLKAIVKKVKQSSEQLRYDDIAVSEISRKHIKLIIENLEKTEGEFSAHKFNKYRSYLSIAFSEIVEWEAIESNIIRDISKRKQVKKIREVLSKDQRTEVVKHLKRFHPEFHTFTQIFFHSGIRITELLSVKIEDVNIKEQKYKVLIKKGTNYEWKECVIKDVALPFWNKAIFGARKNDFVFSTGLVPGSKKLSYNAIRLRWKRNVKTMLNITADFYSLKHLNLDETTEMLSLEDAARMANHKGTKMVSSVYAVGEKQRQFEKLKKVSNSL